MTFWARIDGYEEEFKFMSLEKIMPFQQLRVHIPFATKDLTAYTRSGKKIRIMANPYLTEENLTFTVECDDPYWARLQSIRCKWYIAFGRYSDTQDSWKYKMKASHTREAVAIALNMAYMFSSERFKTALYEFGPLHSNNDKTEIDKTALLANVLNHRGLTFGYTTGVMGLGGGTTFGMHEVCYLEHYADDKSITETIFHKFAMEAAMTLAANGIKAYKFESLRPTPELSFAVRELGCVAGINITASHNPPEYNGYKVY